MAVVLALSDYWWGWGNLLFRWLHVIAAMAWIGASFYFIALDNHLEPPKDPDDARRGVGGEAWEVHGGGFYRVEKFRVAPDRLPEPLHWFKWEAYTTWLSGFALFVVVYYAHATAYLIDPSVADLDGVAGDRDLDRRPRARVARLRRALPRVRERRRRCSPCSSSRSSARPRGRRASSSRARAAYLQVGAMIGTMMVGNVFFVIIPAHWKLVRAKEAGREPDPQLEPRRQDALGAQQLPDAAGRLRDARRTTSRSLYGHAHGWIVLVAMMAIGALVRHYFNLRHRGLNVWPILGLAGACVLAVALLTR